MLNKIKDYPSPVSYKSNIAFISDKPKYSIPKLERKDDFNTKFRILCPGPEKYSPNINVTSAIKRSPSWLISKSKKLDLENYSGGRQNKVGPGSYEIKIGNIPQGPMYTINKMTPVVKIDKKPGPGAYNAKDNNRPNEPKYSIGKEQRGDDLKRVKKDAFPGPGAYKTIDLGSSPKISFPKGNNSCKNKDNVPGPGFYKIPTSFDNINSMVRSSGGFDPAFQYV